MTEQGTGTSEFVLQEEEADKKEEKPEQQVGHQ